MEIKPFIKAGFVLYFCFALANIFTGDILSNV